VIELALRANQPRLADTRVRKAILGLLNVDLLAAVGAGSDNTITMDRSLIRAPSDPGYVPTAPPAMTTAAALGLLESSGYRIDSDATPSPPPPPDGAPAGPVGPHPAEITRGRVSKNGEQLSLVIGVAANDPTSLAVANTAADQLRNVGIAATVLALDPVRLYREALIANQVDAVVGWQQAGGDLATVLASRYGCTALQATAVSAGAAAPPPATAPRDGVSPPPPPPPRPPGPGALVKAPSNITGICDRGIQSSIEAALDGRRTVSEVIAAVEARLWEMATVLPILQDTTIVAAGPSVENVHLSGAVPVGIVGDAGQWVKSP
jgi:ABC-type transport system substrate-binding protein